MVLKCLHKMKILIVEDDALAAEYIEKLVHNHFSELEIVGKAATVKEASKIYNFTKPDLLIMDINLGDHDSFELFEYIDPSLLTVVFTSSHYEFALRAIKIEAVDYLIKPIKINEFKLAIAKVLDRIKMRQVQQLMEQNKGSVQPAIETNKILLYEDDKMHPVTVGDIVKVKSCGAYSDIHLIGDRVITSTKNIGMYETLLKGFRFLRIHDSCLINSAHVLSYKPGVSAFIALTDNTMEAVSKRRKREFLLFYGNK